MWRSDKTLAFLVVVAVLTLDLFSTAQSPKKAVMAYFEGSGSANSLHEFASYLDQIPTDTFAIDKRGKVSGAAPVSALNFARAQGMRTFATVSNFGATDFVPGIAHAILNSSEIRAQAIQNMLNVVETYDYSGINIDFEAVPHEDRGAFTAFIRATAKTMRSAGYLTVVSVPAELQDDPNDSWTGAFDFKALGRDADILQLMTYDENGPWGPPGPVAGLNWVEPCVRYAVSVVPSRKVSLGIPAYGYDWDLTKGMGYQIYWHQIQTLISKVGAAPQWDAATSSPYFTYTAANGTSHVVWYEDAQSVPLKSKLAVRYDLAGVSVFALGFENRKFWEAVSSGLVQTH
jgi:spore germination protein YaaH